MTHSTREMDALIVGAGPAGLMAAEVLSNAGKRVVIADAMPSPARKFLMAGKSGLNLTKNEPEDRFLAAFEPIPDALRAALMAFGPQDVIAWAEGLGQEMFTGSSGRVFPKVMKASPLLRAWLARLGEQGVTLHRHWRMISVREGVRFETPEGHQTLHPRATIFALGGASWARLGSNAAWVDLLSEVADVTPFAPSNVGLCVPWSPHMTRHFGRPVKGIQLTAGDYTTRGECVITRHGLEGGGIYSLTRGLRQGAPLEIDFLPDWPAEKIKSTLIQRKKKETLTKFLQRAFRLSPEKIALLLECAGPKPDNLGQALKSVQVSDFSFRPMDEAISTAGGVRFESLTDRLESRAKPGFFFAGEMLDWDAPTGGYLLTACLATGRLAAEGALRTLS